jgi:hypothetical protein
MKALLLFAMGLLVSILFEERIQQTLTVIPIKSRSTRTFIVIDVPCLHALCHV